MLHERVREHIRQMQVKQNWLSKQMQMLEGALSLILAGKRKMTAEKCKRELTNIAESGKSELHQAANLKAAYMCAEDEFRKLKDQAFEHIRASEDPKLMRALYQVRVHNVPWEDIPRRLLSNRSEMDL